MSAAIPTTTTAYAAPATTYAAPAYGGATGGAAPTMAYGATTMSMGAMPAYGAGMSYVPPAAGGYGASPYLDESVINTQKLDATNALTNQHKLQGDMLNHQFEAQKNILQAEYTRNCAMAEQQFQQQMLQQTMALEQQFKQQQMELDMAKQAQQHKM